MRMTVRLGGARRAATLLCTVAAASTSIARAARAQGAAPASIDSRWTAWLGCWQQVASPSSGDRANGRMTCNVPGASATAIQSISLVDGKITARRRIDAGGREHAIDEAGCRGTESAKFGVVGRRVYLRARYTCAGTLNGASSTIFAMSPAGEWLEIESVNADGGAVGRAARWRDAGTPDGLPREITTALAGRQLAITTARAAASRRIRSDDVVEAVRSADSSAVLAWLGETRQRFALTGPELTVLTHAEVPASVLRAMMGDFGDQQAMLAQDAAFDADAAARTNALLDAQAARQYDEAVRNQYSGYNGYSSYPVYRNYPGSYSTLGYGYGYPGGYGLAPVPIYPIGVPFVVVRGGRSGRPNRPESHGPLIGVRPQGVRPAGGTPVAPGKPVARMPMRGRP